MRCVPGRLMLVLLAAAILTPAVGAQGRLLFRPSSYLVIRQVVPVPPVVTVNLPTATRITAQTSVTVPDGGTVSVASYSSMSEGRSEYGVPIVGKLPLVGRGFRNTGYGRQTRSSRISVRVRIYSLRDEEFRQTGFRSP